MISLMVRGAALVTASLMAAVFYVSQSPDWGWADALTLPALAGRSPCRVLYLVRTISGMLRAGRVQLMLSARH